MDEIQDSVKEADNPSIGKIDIEENYEISANISHSDSNPENKVRK